jgi:two-component system CheB/CheR fusion protein
MSNAADLQKSLRIYVVENHPDTLKYLEMYLKQLGHTVQHSLTMTEAIEAIPTAQCDVLLSDIGLPDGDGWQLLHHLSESGQPYPPYAIAMSGFGMGNDRAKSKAVGFRHHLLKPFKPDELDDLLEEASRERVGKKVARGV